MRRRRRPLIVNTKLHVANLGSTTTARDLRDLFSAYGNVAEVNLLVERESRPPGRFAIVTMATPEGARAATLALNGKEVEAGLFAVAEYVATRKVPPATRLNGKAPGSVVKQKVSPLWRFLGSF